MCHRFFGYFEVEYFQHLPEEASVISLFFLELREPSDFLDMADGVVAILHRDTVFIVNDACL